jgi:hypothetical protein
MGATGTRLSLRPLIEERVERDAKLGQYMPRERELTSLSQTPPSCPRRRASSTPLRLSGSTAASGVLDRPLSRTTTAESCLTIESELLHPSLRAQRSNPFRQLRKHGLLRSARNDDGENGGSQYGATQSSRSAAPAPSTTSAVLRRCAGSLRQPQVRRAVRHSQSRHRGRGRT